MSKKEPARELRVCANKAGGFVEVALLAEGNVLGSVRFTQQEAEHHARCVIKAIEIVNVSGAKTPKLILPGMAGLPN